jgi:hypothetical protein
MPPDSAGENDNALLGLSAAPEMFVEGYRGAMTRQGLVKLNFFSLRFDPGTERIEKHAVVTLTIPASDFSEMVRALNALRDSMEEAGALPKEVAE